MPELIFEFTHFYDTRQGAWCVYRRRIAPDQGQWTIYMGPFENEERAKEKCAWLSVHRRTRIERLRRT